MIAFRPATSDDQAFILATWLKACRREERRDEVESLLLRSSVTVAHLPDDPWYVLGYIVAEPACDAVHFAYVRFVHRRRGIARALVQHALPGRTEINTTARLRFAEPPGVRFHPHLRIPHGHHEDLRHPIP